MLNFCTKLILSTSFNCSIAEKAKVVEQPTNIITTLTQFESTIYQTGDEPYRFICQVSFAFYAIHTIVEKVFDRSSNTIINK